MVRRLAICAALVIVAVWIAAVFMQYFSAARKLGDISGLRMTNAFTCPVGKNVHLAIAFGREVPPTGPIPAFRAKATLKNQTTVKVLVDSSNTQSWVTLPHSPGGGGFIFNWPPTNGRAFSRILQPGHSYQFEIEFEQLPTVPASIWLAWKERNLDLWQQPTGTR